MLKHGLAFIIFSIVALLFLTQVAAFLHLLGAAHAWLADKLWLIFASTGLGKFVVSALALMIIPLLIALIPAFIYWLIRRREMPYFTALVWLIWVMLLTIIAL